MEITKDLDLALAQEGARICLRKTSVSMSEMTE